MISEKTWIPLGASILIFGAAMWLTTVYAQGLENQKALLDLKSQRKDLYQVKLYPFFCLKG